MCGIAGLLGRLDDRNRAALRRMSEALVHRGPDDAGTWESTPDAVGQGAMFAFRRLAILDLSPAGHQPMVDPVHGDVLVFNGEVYNYRDLRDELTARGHAFASSGDTAVVLRMLATEGRAALRRLRGMYALAAWNPARRTLLLARDPLGIKPLYVARCADRGSGWTLAFASELRALLASGLLGTPRLEPHAAATLAWNGFVPGPRTAVAGVELVSPAQAREYGDGGVERAIETTWTLPAASGGPVSTEEEVAAELERSVRLHLVSDVPLAVFLSGGVDSSAVANLARRTGTGPVHTFTLGFEERELDEGPAARAIAAAIGTEHREVVLTESGFVERLDRALDSLDQPTFDGLNAYVMSTAVREAGFTVALVGTGGDELFGGYGSFRDLPVLQRWARRTRWVPGEALAGGARLALRALQPERSGTPRQTRWAKLPDMLRRQGNLLGLYQLAYGLFLPDFHEALLASTPGDDLRDGLPADVADRLETETRGRSTLSALGVLEQRLFLGERLLRDNDVASMAASLEQRLPLVDTAVLEAVMRLPDAVRFRPVPKKTLLRRVGLRGLPPALFDRPKQGFVLPFDRWIRRRLGDAMDATLRDEGLVRAAGLRPEAVAGLWTAFRSGAPGLYWNRVWALYVLVRWCARHGVRAG